MIKEKYKMLLTHFYPAQEMYQDLESRQRMYCVILKGYSISAKKSNSSSNWKRQHKPCPKKVYGTGLCTFDTIPSILRLYDFLKCRYKFVLPQIPGIGDPPDTIN